MSTPPTPLTAGEETVEFGGGARLWTVTEGQGRPMVCCHGGPGGMDTLAPVARTIADLVGADFQRLFTTPTVRHRLRALDVPVLLVPGEADPRPLPAVQALATELPHGRLAVLDRVAHFPYQRTAYPSRDRLHQHSGRQAHAWSSGL